MNSFVASNPATCRPAIAAIRQKRPAPQPMSSTRVDSSTGTRSRTRCRRGSPSRSGPPSPPPSRPPARPTYRLPAAEPAAGFVRSAIEDLAPVAGDEPPRFSMSGGPWGLGGRVRSAAGTLIRRTRSSNPAGVTMNSIRQPRGRRDSCAGCHAGRTRSRPRRRDRRPADIEGHLALEHPEPLVLVVMNMLGGLGAGRLGDLDDRHPPSGIGARRLDHGQALSPPAGFAAARWDGDRIELPFVASSRLRLRYLLFRACRLPAAAAPRRPQSPRPSSC